MPQEVIAVGYDDPRPALRLLMSFAPVIGGTVRSFAAEIPFEVDSIPNAQEVTRLLFPNVSTTVDDGKTLRIEGRSSLALPFSAGIVDTFGLFFVIGAAQVF
jgi:hypothetical protein